MAITERFHKRKESLGHAFNKNSLVSLWRDKVKSQIRSMGLKDLHDYYDFNVLVEENVEKIISQLLLGQYNVTPPVIYTLEKKLGICRHMIIPSPIDAIVLQKIVEVISVELLKNAPSKNAYYSRDRSSRLKLLHENDEPYDFFAQWKKYQKDICDFQDEKEFLVVADLSNYYDTIRLRELRNVVSSYVKTDEVFLDLVLDIVDKLSWKSDYLPSSGIGLPTVNIEGIRLLAHSFLFELDEVVDRISEGHFVRWMDDIVVGVDSIFEGKKIIKNMAEVLKSRGLYLNVSKTQILHTSELEKYYLFNENKYLNSIEKGGVEEVEFLNRFNLIKKEEKARNYDKILKRYLTIAGNKGFTCLLPFVVEMFDSYSVIRPHICRYLKKIGFNQETNDIYFNLLEEISHFDDVSLFELINLATDWDIGQVELGKNFVKRTLAYLNKRSSNIMGFYLYLCFSAKYEKPQELFKTIHSKTKIWSKDAFLARQVASVLPRIKPFSEEKCKQVEQKINNMGLQDAISVLSNFEKMCDSDPVGLNLYLFPKTFNEIYPLCKYLILYNKLHEDSKFMANNKKNIKKYITDSWYKHWIDNYILEENTV